MGKRYLILLIFPFIWGCKKDKLIGYSEKPRVYFELNKVNFYNTHPNSTAGNLLVNFSKNPSTITSDTLLIPVLVTGPLSDSIRRYKLRIEDSGTEENIDYKLLKEDFVIQSDSIHDTLPVIVLRNDQQKLHSVSFRLSLVENYNFQLGPQADTINFSSNSTRNNMRLTSLKITITDVLKKPSNWNDFLETYFGSYSKAKYRFIIDVLEIATIPSNTSVRNMNSYKTTLTDALNEYNNTHSEPLRDENGQDISF